MKYLYYFCAGLLGLAFVYCLFGIGNFSWAYYNVQNPKAEFQTYQVDKSKLTLVDFTNYRCGGCKKMFPILMEMRELHPDVTYISRPIILPENPKAPNKQQPVPLENLAIAAGLQGFFKEFHQVFMEYPETLIPEAVLQETANLYGIDYDRLIIDAKGDQVRHILEDNNKDMNALSIRSIPSYILGKNIYSVGQDLPNLKNILDIIAENKK